VERTRYSRLRVSRYEGDDWGGGGPAAEQMSNWQDWFWPPVWSSWALVLVAGWAGWVALKTLDALERQASIARDTLVLTQRPKLIVRNVVLMSPLQEPPPGPDPWFYKGARLSGQFYVVNVGGTPATITESGCWVVWKVNNQSLAGLPMRRPYEGQNGNNPVLATLNPGESAPGIFQSDEYLDDEINQVRGGSWRLYVLGWVEYLDERKVKRRTGFCRQYDVNKRRFFAVKNDPDYEHAE
jgi:hypothetical protein